MKTASIRLSIITTVSALLLLSAGCSDDPAPNEQTETETSSPEMVQREAPGEPERQESPSTTSPETDFRVMPRVSGQLEEDGMGLDTIIDASSKRAYAESLRWIAEDASQEQMQQLERSIRFIHMYDSSIMGSEERLMGTIDGMTGNEIISRATELQKQRRSGG